MKNADLINHFRSFISTDPERKAAVKQAFKSYVDSVAVVNVENGEKYVCLRKRFRRSVKREDGHHGPDSTAVLDTSLSAAVAHDNRRDNCLAPVKPDESQSHARNTTVPPEDKDAKQEIPPVSVCAGAGTSTPPNISHTCPDGSGSAASRACTSVADVPEDKTEMGNQHTRNVDAGTHRRSVRRSDETLQTTGKCVPEIAVTEPSPLPVTDGRKFFHFPSLPTPTEAPSEGRADQSHPDRSKGGEYAPSAREDEDAAGAGTGSPRLSRGGSCQAGAEEGRSDSASSTPKGSRKCFIEHMMSSSPQVRRSMALRHSRYAAKSDSDSSSVNFAHAEEESAAATLEPMEHEWMMCACDGDWDSLHRLLNCEPSLVSKKDFVTGFTCLHWAAKLGKHELLAQIVNFARQRGVALDVNTRSSAGYTPLHLAAMHNHIEVIKMLVGACDADVEARDYSGKKASHYLRSDVAQDVLDITGADATCDPESDVLALGDEAARWKLPRVLQANLRLLNRSASEEDDRDCIGGLGRDRPLRRKSSLNKLKPRLGKTRAGITSIVHSTSHFERLEGATCQTSGPFRSRPKSNLFG